MPLLPRRRVSARAWWALFALLIAAPALALSWLGLRAVRADRLEAEQRLRAQQRQVAQLADAAIQTALARIETELRRLDGGGSVFPRATPDAAQGRDTAIPADAPLVLFHRSGLVTFPRDRAYFGPFGRVPADRAQVTGWTEDVARLVEEAQAAEVQRRGAAAIHILARIGRMEPRLRAWAAIAAARIRTQPEGSPGQIPIEEWTRADAVTPSGLPAAFVAAAMSDGRPREARAPFVPLILATLDGVRSGRWWLSADERRFHDARLQALLAEAGARAPAPQDDRFATLSEVDQLLRQFPPSRRNGPTHAVERGRSTTYLMVWSPSEQDPEAWVGTVLTHRQIAPLIGPPLERLFAAQPFTGAVRDGHGGPIWSQPSFVAAAHTEPLLTLAGWDVAFAASRGGDGFLRRESLWYAFVALLLVTLLAGIGMTAQVARREMELTRMQAEFVAAVTHEFKSPITSIRLLLERVVAGRFSTAQSASHYYSAIGQETDRLERLVNRVLEAQRIESGQRRYAFEPESIEELTADVVRHLQPIAEARNIRIDIEVPEALPPVAVDRAAITDAIENVVENAIKYSRAGTRIVVRLRASAGRVSIDVADQGIGIERDELPRVFDKFYRARRGDLQNVRGTGLGLALVKAAVEAHGGSVEVESEPGAGSCFSLKLPA